MSTSTSQTWQPNGKPPTRTVWSPTPRSGPFNCCGRSLAFGEPRQLEQINGLLAVGGKLPVLEGDGRIVRVESDKPRAPCRARSRHRPPRESRCSRSASSGPNASRRRPRSGQCRGRNSECTPAATPSQSETSCGNAVSWPWPLAKVPSVMSTVPSDRTCKFGALARRAAGRLDVVGDADATMFAASSRFLAPRLEAGPVAQAQCLVHRARVVAAVVGQAKAVAMREAVLARPGCAGAARRGRCPIAVRR